ncbi:Putative periplasmic protein [hydrothermal vent metagenome]|uniref:Periplasmic protein n=1 Tax=hydrothermal vent metagenome TaxID=652676 RepID=A0A3B1D894_9ZZZZ
MKGLSEREYPADIVIWPIQFTQTSNNLEILYNSIDKSKNIIKKFLMDSGVEESEISLSTPSIVDKSAQNYGGNNPSQFRFTSRQTVTVYSKKVDLIRSLMNKLSSLGKKGIVFSGNDYDNRTEFIFSKLNSIKPEMIQEATTKAREVAQKFAEDSNSELGKIKRAYQGQFSIYPRDRNNPHIKKIRVVSTVEYYLSD